MKQIVEEFGWPTMEIAATDGARAAWMLVQHADHDVAFQRSCLTLMELLRDTGQVRREDLAYLTDRVLVNEGKEQTYGTQFHVAGGVRQPRPIRDAEKVDERRKVMGLSTLDEYAEFMNT